MSQIVESDGGKVHADKQTILTSSILLCLKTPKSTKTSLRQLNSELRSKHWGMRIQAGCLPSSLGHWNYFCHLSLSLSVETKVQGDLGEALLKRLVPTNVPLGRNENLVMGYPTLQCRIITIWIHFQTTLIWNSKFVSLDDWSDLKLVTTREPEDVLHSSCRQSEFE